MAVNVTAPGSVIVGATGAMTAPNAETTLRTNIQYTDDAMRPVRSAISRALAGGAVCNIMVFGDSITNGFNSTGNGVRKMYSEVLRVELKRRMGFTDISHGDRLASNFDEYRIPKTIEATNAGNQDRLFGTGFGGGSDILNYGASDGSTRPTLTITTTEQCNRLIVIYQKNSTSATVNPLLRIDSSNTSDGSSGLLTGSGLSTYNASAPTQFAGGANNTVWDSGNLGGGLANRTFTFSPHLDATRQGNLVINNLYILNTSTASNGDNAVRVWSGGQFGSKISDHNAAQRMDLAGNQYSAGLTAECCIVNLGTNDTITSYKANLASFITNLLAQYTGNFKPTIIIMPPPPSTNWSKADSDEARNFAYTTAQAFTTAVVFDWPSLFSTIISGQDFWGLSGSPGDVHPSDTGHRLIAQSLAAFIWP